jgi:hypothetical protein
MVVIPTYAFPDAVMYDFYARIGRVFAQLRERLMCWSLNFSGLPGGLA